MKKINRRQFAKKASWATGIAVMPSVVLPSTENYPIVHHVFFWLKNPQSVTDRNQLVDGVKTLAKISTVRQIHVGIVAQTEKRDVVDQSWGVSELLFFTDLKAQATYQTHPIHLEFIKNYSHLWDKVVVYDVQQA